MREKLFTLTRSQRDDLWRRYKQTSDRRVAERLHALLLLDQGRSAHEVSAILHLHPKTLKRWVKLFAASGVEGLSSFNYVGNTPWLSEPQIQQFTAWLDEGVRSTKKRLPGSSSSLALTRLKVACSNSSSGSTIATSTRLRCLPKLTRTYRRS